MAELLAAPSSTARRAYVAVVLAVSVAPIALVVLLAPPAGAAPATALGWLLFVGSSVHVGSTAWFYTVPEVRRHMARHRTRYVVVPLALIAGGAVVAAFLSTRELALVLLAFFGWQFWHFQKQNLGLAALTARARRLPGLTTLERRALQLAGLGGIAGLLGHPNLLQIADASAIDALFALGAAIFLVAAVVGVAALADAGRRDPAYVAAYLVALLFFAPVWLFASPYAAVAGLTIAHGLQYLVLMTLLARGPSESTPAAVSLLVLVNLALIVGFALNRLSHLHGHPGATQALFGVFLGASMAHFVIDAGMWRLRDEFPREFLTRRLSFLLA